MQFCQQGCLPRKHISGFFSTQCLQSEQRTERSAMESTKKANKYSFATINRLLLMQSNRSFCVEDSFQPTFGAPMDG